jgi:hypothetical protein
VCCLLLLAVLRVPAAGMSAESNPSWHLSTGSSSACCPARAAAVLLSAALQGWLAAADEQVLPVGVLGKTLRSNSVQLQTSLRINAACPTNCGDGGSGERSVQLCTCGMD